MLSAVPASEVDPLLRASHIILRPHKLRLVCEIYDVIVVGAMQISLGRLSNRHIPR